ncbi:MAG: DUF4065 domain-containing protein [Holophaga sp.]|nr:DUF4065 domain-containing protein [Holophaga sp.]
MANAMDVARHILAKAHAKGISLDPMKLQKMVYFAQGWSLGLGTLPLFDEKIEAWPYGPVVESVYHGFKKYGSGNIPKEEGKLLNDLDPISDNLIDQVLDIYGKYSGPVLSGMTHETGSPWGQTYITGFKSVPISDEIITSYFSHLKSANKIY